MRRVCMLHLQQCAHAAYVTSSHWLPPSLIWVIDHLCTRRHVKEENQGILLQLFCVLQGPCSKGLLCYISSSLYISLCCRQTAALKCAILCWFSAIPWYTSRFWLKCGSASHADNNWWKFHPAEAANRYGNIPRPYSTQTEASWSTRYFITAWRGNGIFDRSMYMQTQQTQVIIYPVLYWPGSRGLNWDRF